MSRNLSNKELAEQKNTTPRQISKSRKRGYILVDGKQVKYKAPIPLHLVLKAIPKKKKKSRKAEDR